MKGVPNSIAKINTASHFPAAATAAVVTIAAVADSGTTKTIHCVRRISCSYNAAPTGGRLTVVAGSTTLMDIDITASGPLVIDFDQDNLLTNNTSNEAVVVTLASGAGAVVGKLSVQYQ
jgi:hypothetical protein